MGEPTVSATLVREEVAVIEAIITFFIVRGVMYTVTTSRVSTVYVTCGALAAIIAVFTSRSVYLAVTTGRERTINITILTLALVIALFERRRVSDPISADRIRTVCITCRGVDRALITLFGLLHDVITAEFEYTIRVTAVAADVITIVTLLITLLHAVTTDLLGTGLVASITAHGVSVIAVLVGTWCRRRLT